jgi:putative transposase
MEKLVPKDRREEIALFRSSIIGALAARDLDHGELRAEFEELAKERFRPPGGRVTRHYSIPTLERWYYAYRRGALPGLAPKARKDRGRARELTEEQRTLLLDIRREQRSASVPLILRTLVAEGRLGVDEVSEATVRRLFAENGLDRIGLRDGAGTRARLRWQAERPGALWHGDVCHGPAVLVDGVLRPLRIHGLLDDYSRYVVALEAHTAEREVEMLGLFVRAMRRQGAPDALYLDNGSTYRGENLRIACERLSVTLIHARPYDAPARGKMERFWRTLRQGGLDFVQPGLTLPEVQARLDGFLESHYHVAAHGGLLGRCPKAVWQDGMGAREPDTLTEQQLARALTVHERRRVRKDSTLSIRGKDYEVEQGFFAGRLVTIVYSLLDGSEAAPSVEHEGKLLKLFPVDPVRNAKRKRLVRPDLGNKTDFDPSRALLAKGRRSNQEDPS